MISAEVRHTRTVPAFSNGTRCRVRLAVRIPAHSCQPQQRAPSIFGRHRPSESTIATSSSGSRHSVWQSYCRTLRHFQDDSDSVGAHETRPCPWGCDGQDTEVQTSICAPPHARVRVDLGHLVPVRDPPRPLVEHARRPERNGYAHQRQARRLVAQGHGRSSNCRFEKSNVKQDDEGSAEQQALMDRVMQEAVLESKQDDQKRADATDSRLAKAMKDVEIAPSRAPPPAKKYHSPSSPASASASGGSSSSPTLRTSSRRPATTRGRSRPTRPRHAHAARSQQR